MKNLLRVKRFNTFRIVAPRKAVTKIETVIDYRFVPENIPERFLPTGVNKCFVSDDWTTDPNMLPPYISQYMTRGERLRMTDLQHPRFNRTSDTKLYLEDIIPPYTVTHQTFVSHRSPIS